MRRGLHRTAIAVLALAAAGCRSTAATTGSAAPAPVPTTEPPRPIIEPPSPPIPASAMLSGRLRAIGDSVAASPMWRNARWGMLIVDPESGDTLLSRDADRLFMPASNQKLLTGAVAVQTLGLDHRWRTPVLLAGTQRGAAFDGDVVVVGGGDPSFSDSLRTGGALASFDPIVEALAARKITRITGRVRAGGDLFAGISTGFGWEIDDLDESYGAPVDELLFNEGELVVWVRAGTRAGRAPTVTTAPTTQYPRVRVDARTRDRAATGTPEPLRLAYDSIASELVVSGSIVTGDSARFFLSYRHPSDAVIAAVTERLRAKGITVQERAPARASRARAVAHAVPSRPPSDTLVVLESAPFADVLRRMQKPSQNQLAEMLFRSSGVKGSGDGSADSARAVAARTLAAWGIGAADAAYRDGSGLSRHDYVTPRALVRTLDVMRRSPAFDAYRAALPSAGVDGTLRNRMRGTPAMGNAHAKTGTVDKARSLSGYVTSADGRTLLFSLLCNNYTVPTREVERVQDMIVVMLASERAAPVSASR